MTNLHTMLLLAFVSSLLGTGCADVTESDDAEMQTDEAAVSVTTSRQVNCTAKGVVGPNSEGYRSQVVSLLVGDCSRPDGRPLAQIVRVTFGFPNERMADARALARGANEAIGAAHRVTFTLTNELTGAYRELRPYARALRITRDGQAPFEITSDGALYNASGAQLRPIR